MAAMRALAVLAGLTTLVACRAPSDDSPNASAYALEATGGQFDDGSGLLGTALLATLRDSAGVGPDSTWAGTLSDGTGPRADVSYQDNGPGSYAALWLPGLPFASGSWGLTLGDGTTRSNASLALAEGEGIAPPSVTLGLDGASLAWGAVTGAARYECRVVTSGAVVMASQVSSPGCDVSDLPDGGYAATVLAFSQDLDAIASDLTQQPSLPPRFDVSEGRVSFLRAGTAPVTVVSAVGGAIDIGLGERTLVVWLSIAQSGGTPTTADWTVAVSGPDLPDSAPITFTYPGNFTRLMRWSYDQPATPGRYKLVATSTAGTVEAEFSVGAPAPLGQPANVTAADGAQGSARVDWTPSSGARSYLVSVWKGAEFVTSQWVGAPPADFPQGSFTAGQLYGVYVAAADADMVGGARPAQVAVLRAT